jgi:hypothetical protein
MELISLIFLEAEKSKSMASASFWDLVKAFLLQHSMVEGITRLFLLRHLLCIMIRRVNEYWACMEGQAMWQ